MKKYTIYFVSVLLSLFSAIPAHSQPFEGVLSYSIGYEVNQKDRVDLEIYKGMMPEKLELSLKGQKSLLKFVGGMAQSFLGDILYLPKEKSLYTIMHTTQTATQTTVQDLKDKTAKDAFVAQKIDTTIEILSYKCQKHVVKDEKEGTETILWCTKEISNASASVMVYFLQSMTGFSVEGVQGLPLKIEFKGKEFNLTLLTENKLAQKLHESEFEVPKHYKIKKAE
jgi:hypothetical protein